MINLRDDKMNEITVKKPSKEVQIFSIDLDTILGSPLTWVHGQEDVKRGSEGTFNSEVKRLNPYPTLLTSDDYVR